MACHAPDPVICGPQNWEQPDDLPCAKQLLEKMRGAKTKALHKDDAFAVAKINIVIQQTHANGSNLKSK